MEDKSELDKKYFIDKLVYNCPFCNRNNVSYSVEYFMKFNWSSEKDCYCILVRCSSCGYHSMHMSFSDIVGKTHDGRLLFKAKDIDSKLFYSVPTSFFVIDSRIPAIIRELITEAEGCLKMNYLTGASVCMRKSIYELLIKEEAEGSDYESRIKFLKTKYPDSDPTLFDILAHIQDMTSDKIHEQSWDKWDSKHLKLFIETLKTVLHDIYVIPEIKADRIKNILKMKEAISTDKKITDEVIVDEQSSE